MLIRLWVRAGLIKALTGREGMPAGDPGGELAMALKNPSLRQNTTVLCGRVVEGLTDSKMREISKVRLLLRSGYHVAAESTVVNRCQKVPESQNNNVPFFPASPSQI